MGDTDPPKKHSVRRRSPWMYSAVSICTYSHRLTGRCLKRELFLCLLCEKCNWIPAAGCSWFFGAYWKRLLHAWCDYVSVSQSWHLSAANRHLSVHSIDSLSCLLVHWAVLIYSFSPLPRSVCFLCSLLLSSSFAEECSLYLSLAVKQKSTSECVRHWKTVSGLCSFQCGIWFLSSQSGLILVRILRAYRLLLIQLILVYLWDKCGTDKH